MTIHRLILNGGGIGVLSGFVCAPDLREGRLVRLLPGWQMIGAWSADRVGVRLSPSSYLYGVDDSRKLDTFGFVVRALDALKVGYLCLLEPNARDAERGVQIRDVAETFRPMTSVPIIVNTGFDKAKANAVLASSNADLVAFGAVYIANPDLVERFRTDAPLNKPDPALYYGVGAKGYTDYPVLPTAVAA